jgi:hypothetical protein
VKMASNIKGATQAEDVREQGAEEGICIEEV